MKSHSERYREAGVDITAGYEAVRRMQAHVRRTATPGVLSGLGGFGGLFAPDMKGMREPVLVSGTDGVGTKLKIAFALNRHDTVGIDCVAMSVNDIVCSGARPLFFLDYIACGHNDPARIEAVVSGVAEGCVRAGCALIGGETAEMPGFYPDDEYDLAGFAVGLVDRPKMLSPQNVQPGDIVLALPSSGVHSNGFSLARNIFGEDALALSRREDSLGMTLGEALLTPTCIYVQPVLAVLEACRVRSAAHITGGGFFENIPRSLPDGLTAHIRLDTLRIPPIFSLIQKAGGISDADMFSTFNMGVGMTLVTAPSDADRALRILCGMGVFAYACGEILPGDGGVCLC